MDRENVFVCQRIGKGKSLCFAKEIRPACHLPTYSNHGMNKLHILNSLGISSAVLERSKDDDQRVKEGKFKYLYASP